MSINVLFFSFSNRCCSQC